MKPYWVWCIAVVALCNVCLVHTYGVNGGLQCAVCTIVTGIFGQVAEIHEEDVVDIALRVCDHLFWPSFHDKCKEAVTLSAPLIIKLLALKEVTPDTFCYGLHICYQDPGEEVCHLFPAPSVKKFQSDVEFVSTDIAKPFFEKVHGDFGENVNVCDLPAIKELCIHLKKIFKGMSPAVDLDGDRFSVFEGWRGSHWRGKDCSDISSKIYPGRRPFNSDVNTDTNCNGIWGRNEETLIPWETKLCASSMSRGLIMLGDSVGAHFHFPHVWFYPMQISRETFFRNASGVLLDELDWPQYSSSTGYKNITEPHLIQGPVDSIYLRLRKRNLCNHRDYQNVCRNGATSFDLLKNVRNIARHTTDKPVTVLLGVFGNDVCNRFPNTLVNMTSPKQFYKNIINVIDYLDSSLPPDSHVVLIGLVNGSFIFETLSERYHPIGEYKKDVKYKDVFRWFRCMQIGPCNGWLNDDKSIRDATSKRALELSRVMKYIAKTYKSNNITLSYVPNPLAKVLNTWKKKGGEAWELFEAIDGFHPNQKAQPIITEVLWRKLKLIAPGSIGPFNPFNDEILQRFGDQGGH